MSKVTDRLDNKQIIELAKQQYEQNKKTSKFPANIINLPSQGNVYEKSSPLRNGQIEMRHMTAYDEDILSNSSYINEGVVFDKLLEALIITPGIHPNDFVAGDKEWAIISARILGYGTEYPVQVTDTKDNTLISAIQDLSKLKSKPFTIIDDGNGLFDYKITTTGDIIKFKYLSVRDIDTLDNDKLNSSFLKHVIYQVNDITSPIEIEEYLQYTLRASESRKLRKYIMDTAPGIDYNTTAVSEDGSTHNAVFQFDADLFWF